MNFHSIDYLLFLPLVVATYFAIPHRWRWALLLLASNLFYASWRWEYLALLWFTTLVDYFAALAMPRAGRRGRNALLAFSLVGNLGLLFVFKYFALLANTTLYALRMGQVDPIEILLPLGISFYTFQTLGYTIDVWRGKRQPERHLGYFAVFVMYFPQLLAGPIERTGKLLPQFRQERRFDMSLVAAGAALMLVGYFKKLVIADRLAMIIPPILADPSSVSPLGAVLASLGNIYRYYADLSGYVDIAIGSSMMIGITLSRNFNRPFAARSIYDYWQRWHITVTTWIRDYVHIPLARKASSRAGREGAVIVTILLVALWHGASWPWIVAGLIAGVGMVAEGTFRRSRRIAALRDGTAQRLGIAPARLAMLRASVSRAYLWFFLILLGSLANAPTMADALSMWAQMASVPHQLAALDLGLGSGFDIGRRFWIVPAAIAALEAYQWLDARRSVCARVNARGAIVSWGFYLCLATVILVLGSFGQPGFIYFGY
ncbi:MBOAT family O-acyltransferase [Paraurantiacibacter namhicola]|uniref:Probable alginate O-acetylase AlgI n=1 Tax=Paraurantiacibacter namhicola TaxID=645517 RepID=A0A1C7D6D9_9SPHN|nr:MBOAT family O-acyltransferase [Paraurantiacibacter namhicola]ANU07056.1 Peptidoglycan O-acetyltransferase [Paraurantiacibacter namhicola]